MSPARRPHPIAVLLLLVVATLVGTVGIASSTVVTLAAGAAAIAALALLWSFLAGESAVATRLRRSAAPSLRSPVERACLLAVVALLFLALVAWAPIVALTSALGVAIFGAAILLGTVLLIRETALEP